MLHLYQSNRLESLGAFFAQMVAAVPLSDPFAAETVIVQSRGMGRWIALDLARRSGIAAHLSFVLPAAFSWRLMKMVMPDLPAQSPFAPDVLQWHLLDLLPTLEGPEFAPLRHYCRDENATFELAGKIADIFDQYLVFRPHWVRNWEQGTLCGLGEDEHWQAALWRQLSGALGGLHRVAMSDAMLAGLRREALPERITLFGIASLAPMYLALLRRLSELTDVCVFLLNPCAEYWGDVAAPQRGLPFEAAPDHPLLASLGKQGRDFFDQLTSEQFDPVDLFPDPEPEPGHLLAALQQDILQRALTVRPGLRDDDSIELHATHGPMRELEVLKDRLLALFEADPTLQPTDVAVLTPDINTYAPCIDAVFGYRADAPSLPYTIADRKLTREEPLLTVFMAVLDLLDGRFTLEEVLFLLEHAPVLRRAGLEAGQVATLRGMLVEAGVRWGRHGGHKATLGLPADDRFTWRWGLDRLLLGCVMPADEALPALFAGHLPAGGARGSDAMMIAGMARLFAALDQLAETVSTPADATLWCTRMAHLLDQLFDVGEEDEAALAQIHAALDAVRSETALAGYTGRFGFAVLRDSLRRRLSAESVQGFLSGAITFCAMVPMRSIPFRVLCLIGMNDGAYPRDERPVSFDLIARHPARGDRSRRFDDRYLFLEALLSARERLYLSYVGLSARSNEPLPPSALIAELCDVLCDMCGIGEPEARSRFVAERTVRHPLQPFSGRSFDGGDPRLASFESAYAEALSEPARRPPVFASALPGAVTGQAAWPAVLSFWSGLPCRTWLQERLALRMTRVRDTLPDSEPFAVTRETREAIRQAFLQGWLAGEPDTRVAAVLRAGSMLPPGALGEAWLAQEAAAVAPFLIGLPAVLRTPVRPPLAFRFVIGDCTLSGMLEGLRAEGDLRVLARPLRAGDRIAAWLRHLVLCALRPDGVLPATCVYAPGETLSFASVEDPLALLEPWVQGWQAGQTRPLPFFPRTSLAFARALPAGEEDDLSAAWKAAFAEWSPPPGSRKFAQSAEPDIRLVFGADDPLGDPLFASLARTLLQPMLAAMQEGEGA